MFQGIYRKLTWVLSALGLLLAPGLAAAQQGEHLYEETGSGWRNTPTYAAPIYTTPATGLPSDAATTQSFYPAESEALNGAVEVDITAPANAQIWFENTPTTQQGAFRRFVSPPLDPGFNYVYQIKAQWTENGQPMTRTRNVTVHAGDVVRLDLNSNR